MTRPRYNHGEAFLLMRYVSARPGPGPDPIVEYLWNSRDGVTPFGIGANPALGERWSKTELVHSEFREDRYEPYWPHTGLKVGDRVFVDMTIERALEWARERERIVQAADPGEPLSEGEIRNLAESFMDDPDILVVDEALLGKLRCHFPKPPVNLMGSRGSDRFS